MGVGRPIVWSLLGLWLQQSGFAGVGAVHQAQVISWDEDDTRDLD